MTDRPSEHANTDDSGLHLDGQALRTYRQLKGWSQKRLANIADVSEKTIRKIETQPSHRCSAANLAKLATALTLDSARLVLGESLHPKLLSCHEDVKKWTTKIVAEAEQFFVATGSRSWVETYLRSIEQALQDRPSLVHYRILFGPPHKIQLQDHLRRLLKTRDPGDRQTLGKQSIHIAVYTDLRRHAEFSTCSNERTALVVLPSVHEFASYDTAVVFNHKDVASGIVQFAKDLYRGGRPVETLQDVDELGILEEVTHEKPGLATNRTNRRDRKRVRSDQLARPRRPR